MKKLLVLSLVFVLLMLALPAIAETYVVKTPRGDGVWARDATRGGKILATLPDGTKLNVTGFTQGWAVIQLNGRTAYVWAEYVAPLRTTPTRPATPSIPTRPSTPDRPSRPTRPATPARFTPPSPPVITAIPTSEGWRIFMDGKQVFPPK